MFKRSTKITSLLVAAASVATMVPAMAADVKKVDENDGIVYKAISYKDGKFYIDGELKDKDEDAYYVVGDEYTKLEDIDSGDYVTPYGEKYVEVDNGDYYLDLETGKVTDDSIADEDLDDAKSALRKKIKKDNDGRYLADEEKEINDSLVAIASNPFSEVWYKADVKAKAADDKKNGSADVFTVYTDKNGNYIDADYNLGKVNVVVGNKTYTIKNTSDDDDSVRAAIRHVKTIGQDKDYIYRVAVLTVNVDKEDVTFGSKNKQITATTAEAAGITTDAAAIIAGIDQESQVSVPVIQKISKAQASDDIDGAKYANTVSTYFISNDKGEKLDLLYGLYNAEDGEDNNVYDKKDVKASGFSVIDGKIVSYVVVGADDDAEKLYAQAITLKSKNGYYYTDLSDGADSDVEGNGAYKVAVDGSLYVLDSGNVKVFDNDEDFNKVYKVDGSLTELSVYDKENIIAWDESDEVYSIVAGEAKTEEETTTDAAATTTGWVQDATTGTWSYVKADGTKAIGWLQSPASGLWYYMDATGTMMANGWVQDAGKWYFLDATGAMKTGWVYTGGAWYYLASNGAMQTGWVQTAGKWYYCNASGAMLANTTVDGYVLGADGAWIK